MLKVKKCKHEKDLGGIIQKKIKTESMILDN